jgi:hypothetical protein
MQKKLFPPFVHLSDELLLIFDDAFQFLSDMIENNEISLEQRDFFIKIDKYSKFLTEKCPDCFSDNMLKNDKRWDNMRELSKNTLKIMQWSSNKPDLSYYTFVKSK